MGYAAERYTEPLQPIESYLLMSPKVCEHGPDTKLIHTGTICGHVADGKVCGRGGLCRFRHGVDVLAKGIEHRLFHHRKFFVERPRATLPQAEQP